MYKKQTHDAALVILEFTITKLLFHPFMLQQAVVGWTRILRRQIALVSNTDEKRER